MSITHCGSWDVNNYLFLPSAIAPEEVSNITQVTSKSKFGAGSLYFVEPNDGLIRWVNLTNLPAMQGSISFWLYPTTGKRIEFYTYLLSSSGFNNYVLFRAILSIMGGTSGLLEHQIWDSSSVQRSYAAIYFTPSMGAGNLWHYIELNWDFATGEINMYYDTTRIYNANIGTGFIRTNTCDQLKGFFTISGNPDEGWLDDWCIWNSVVHTGNPIVVPTDAYCALSSLGQVSFGSQFSRFNANFSR